MRIPRRERDSATAGRRSDDLRQAGLVYFVREGHDGPIKIGYALEPIQRLKSLQIGNPRLLVLVGYFPGDVAMERRLHARFADWRLNGEWFSPDAPGLVDLAKAAGQIRKAIDGGLDALPMPLVERALEALSASDPAKQERAETA